MLLLPILHKQTKSKKETPVKEVVVELVPRIDAPDVQILRSADFFAHAVVLVEHAPVPAERRPGLALRLLQLPRVLVARAPQRVDVTLVVVHLLNKKVPEVAKGLAMGGVNSVDGRKEHPSVPHEDGRVVLRSELQGSGAAHGGDPLPHSPRGRG